MSNNRRKLVINTCTSCGYDLRGTESGVCPECGTLITDMADKAGNEYGYVSFVLGVALFIMVPITLNFNVNLWSEGPNAGPTSIPMDLAYPGGLIGLSLIMLVALFSVCCGVRGLMIASKQGNPRIIPLAGTFVSVIAFLLWIMVAIDLALILSSFGNVNY